MPEQNLQNKKSGVFSLLAVAAFWPLRKLLAYSLENPGLLQLGTRFVSHFPVLFNWLIRFAQAHGIVMAADESNLDIDEIQSVSELTPGAQLIFESLTAAFKKGSEKKY